MGISHDFSRFDHIWANRNCSKHGSRFGANQLLQVNISLASCGETLSLPEPSRMGDLKILSEKSLSQGFLKLSLFWTTLCNPCKWQGVHDFSSVIPLHFAAGCCLVQRSDTAVVVCRLFHSARSAQQSVATSSPERAFAAILANG